MLRDIVVIIPVVILLAKNLGVVDLLYSAPIADVANLVVVVIIMKKTIKELDRINLEEHPVAYTAPSFNIRKENQLG